MAQVLSVTGSKTAEQEKDAQQKSGRPARVLSLPDRGEDEVKKRADEQVAVLSMLILM